MTTQNTALNQNSLPNEPQLKDVLDQWKKTIFADLFCHHLGTIESFDITNQTAMVKINYPRTKFNFDTVTGLYAPEQMEYAILRKCPVICLGGGNASLRFPITPGDQCLVLFNDRNIDNWFNGQNGATLATARLHSFADAIALVGLYPLDSSLEDYSATDVELTNGVPTLSLSPTTAKLSNTDKYLLLDATHAQLLNSAASVRLSTTQVNISNQLTSLKDIMAGVTGVISIMTDITSGLSSLGLPAPAIAALTAKITALNILIASLLE